jgi:hypothetical protein
MPEWNVDPERLACIVMQQYPRDPEGVVLDFLDAAAQSKDHDKTLFWTLVFSIVEQMHKQLTGEPVIAREIRCGTVM